jgi:predicted Fe-Mo cluster-binding NifX family protein
MKVAISATNPDLDCEMDTRFGRCTHFIVIDPDTMQYESLDNPHATTGGAGIGAAQFIANKEVGAIITGSVGPNAHKALSAAGIQMYTGVSGRIRDVIEMYKSGRLRTETQPGAARGMGCGSARGMGMGRGRGMGRMARP